MVGGNVAYPSYYRPVCAGLTQRDTKYSQLWIIQNHQLLENPEKVTQINGEHAKCVQKAFTEQWIWTHCLLWGSIANYTVPSCCSQKKRKRKKGQKYKTQWHPGWAHALSCLGKADDITCHTFISKVFNFPHFSFSKCRNMLWYL